MSGNPSIRVPTTVHERAKQLKDEYDFASVGEAVRHMCRSGKEFDV